MAIHRSLRQVIVQGSHLVEFQPLLDIFRITLDAFAENIASGDLLLNDRLLKRRRDIVIHEHVYQLSGLDRFVALTNEILSLTCAHLGRWRILH